MNKQIVLEFIVKIQNAVGNVKALKTSLVGVKDASEEVKSNTKDMAKTMREAGKEARGAGKSARQAGQDAKEGGKNADKAAGFWSKLGKSFKRIFLYRTIRKVISEIGQAAREGLGNLYDFSASMGSLDSFRAKANLDSLATSALYVKNSLAAALAPVIQMITPLVEKLADVFATAANAVAQLFGALSGGTTYTKALKFPTQLKQGFGGASAAAKELRRTLLGFDEINRLDMETPSGGGGGVGGIDASQMFDDPQPIAEKYQKLAKKIKDLAPIVLAVGGAFAAWKLSSSFLGKLKSISPILSKIPADAGLAAAGIALVGAALVDAYNNNESFRTGVDAVVKVIKDNLVPWLKEAWKWLDKFNLKIGDLTINLPKIPFANAQYRLQNWSDTLLKSIPIVGDIYTKIKNLGFMLNNCSEISQVAKTVISNMFDALNSKSRLAGEAFEWLISKMLKPLEKLAKVFDGIFKTNFSAQIAELQALVNSLGNTGKSVVVSGAKNALVRGFASGGFVSTGDLFIARENGIPEMVGQIGNQTAVANNDQIVEAIKQGVYEAMTASGGKETRIYVDGKQLFEVVTDRNNAEVRMTGKSPLMV